MNILIACEYSGVIRDLFHEMYPNWIVWSCDLLPSESTIPNSKHINHYMGDVFDLLSVNFEIKWDMVISHPPCTYLASSGLHWNSRKDSKGEFTEEAIARQAKTEESLEFVRKLLYPAQYGLQDIEYIAIENPKGCISTRIEKFTQSIQPYQFGDDASKSTYLWLKNLPLLKPTEYYPPRIVESGPYAGKERWSNQTDSGQNVLPPSKDRAKIRSRTYDGIAIAIVDQWGSFLELQCQKN